MSDVPNKERPEAPSCPRCNVTMVQVVHVDAFGEQPALDAYECPICRHILSRAGDGGLMHL